MRELLTEEQTLLCRHFRDFAARDIRPFAEEWDREQRIPTAIISKLGKSGFLSSTLPKAYGGQGWDMIVFGLLNEAFGRESSALTGVLTVQAMVSMSLAKWGTEEQKQTWLPRLAKGKLIGAFALTEPNAGSDLQNLATKFTGRFNAGELILNGDKKWISCAQFADLLLVFGKLDNRPLACLVPRESSGLSVAPIEDMMGFRAAGLAQVRFDDVRVPADCVVGKPGFALSHVAQVGLQHGRISTAASGLGLLRGCFEESIAYASTRTSSGRKLGEMGMIRSLIAQMGADLEAANYMCHHACRVEEEHLPEAFEKALLAKYFTSRAAVKAASHAVQIRGASGCQGSSLVSRYYRDAKILEIIEGTTQIHEQLLGRIFVDQSGNME